ncbi:MAG: glycine cleavage system protein GcvH [Ktedonobacterales bacterium]
MGNLIPGDLRYAETDEWVRVEGDEATIGISDFAQNELGDVVYLELPWADAGTRTIQAGDHFGDVESVKATSPLFSPVSGLILSVNEDLRDQSELVNSEPYGKGWMLVIKLSNPAELESLMNAATYEERIKTRKH